MKQKHKKFLTHHSSQIGRYNRPTAEFIFMSLKKYHEYA